MEWRKTRTVRLPSLAPVDRFVCFRLVVLPLVSRFRIDDIVAVRAVAVARVSILKKQKHKPKRSR